LTVQHAPPSGLRLVNVTDADSGTYSIHVNVESHGTLVTYAQSVHVRVTVGWWLPLVIIGAHFIFIVFSYHWHIFNLHRILFSYH
jgi:hypothetical protein